MINKNYLNSKKDEFLYFQELATLGFILALFISFTLTYDKRMSREGKKRLYTDKESQNLALFQTILVFIVALAFLYINAQQYKLAKLSNNKDSNDLFLQIETSLLAIISAIIGLYIVFKNYRNNNLTISEADDL